MSLTADQTTDLAEIGAQEIKGRSLLQDAKRRFYRNKAAVASLLSCYSWLLSSSLYRC